ncbi:MAG: lipoprotein signal peptidase [Fimbriimonadales bacterium]
MNRHGLAIAVFAVSVALDRVVKLWVQSALAEHQSVPAIPGVLYITLTYNTGIAFGLLQNAQWLTVPVSALVIAGALAIYLRLPAKDRFAAVALAMLLGGAVANLYDRIVHGRVTDMFDLRWWPVFNVADSLICVAVALLVVRAMFAPHQNQESAVRPGESG